jgi:hypothetical protein
VKDYLRNIMLGVPLALGAILTLAAVVLTVEGGDDLWRGLVVGLVGIPLLFATLAALLRDP